MLPLVSVIIPVYNVSQYLREAIDSVIAQTYTNLEILVIDDGSTDGSSRICDEYEKIDERIVLIHQENKGLSAARNSGLDLASGQIIGFLDSDDAYHPRAIEILVGEMVSCNSDIVICDFTTHKTHGRMKIDTITDSSIGFDLITKRQAFHKVYNKEINTAPWNKIYTKAIWDGLRFPEGHVCEGTYCIFDILVKSHRVSLTNEKLIMHRNRPNSICNTRNTKHIYDYGIARDHYYSFVKEHTPDIFSWKQLKRLKWERLRETIVFSIKLNILDYKENESGQISDNMLYSVGEALDINHCCFGMKTVFYTAPIVLKLSKSSLIRNNKTLRFFGKHYANTDRTNREC